MYKLGRDKSNALLDTTGAGFLLVFQQMSKEAVTKGQDLGHNAFGMAVQTQSCKYNTYLFFTGELVAPTVLGFTATATWQDDAHDETMHQAIDSMGDEVAQIAVSMGLSRPLLFPNDASYSQNPMKSFGNENLSRLRAVSRKYDPGKVFQRVQNGGFKLGLVWVRCTLLRGLKSVDSDIPRQSIQGLNLPPKYCPLLPPLAILAPTYQKT